MPLSSRESNGGFDLAAQWMGWKNVFQVEWDLYCQEVLKKNFKQSQRYGNIDEFDGKKYRGTINVLSGGPPCQPASNAGKRKGEKDDRWKWPEAIRVFGEIMPDIGVFENPDDLLTLDNGRAFERICLSLEDFGYTVETYGIPAACVGAWHERDRIWIIAYANHLYDSRGLDTGTRRAKAKGDKISDERKRETSHRQRIRFEPLAGAPFVTNTDPSGLPFTTCSKLKSLYQTYGAFAGSSLNRRITETGAYWKTEPGVGRMVHGIPNRVDRIKALGNAVVPQVVFEIFKTIQSMYDQTK